MMDALQTRLITPAPADIRAETGVIWYEASVDATARSVRVAGYRSREDAVAYSELRLTSDTGFTSTIRDGGTEVRMDVRVELTRTR